MGDRSGPRGDRCPGSSGKCQKSTRRLTAKPRDAKPGHWATNPGRTSRKGEGNDYHPYTTCHRHCRRGCRPSAAAAGPRFNVNGIPAELKALPRWVRFDLYRDARGKLKKVPRIPGTNAEASNRTRRIGARSRSPSPMRWRGINTSASSSTAPRPLSLSTSITRSARMACCGRARRESWTSCGPTPKCRPAATGCTSSAVARCPNGS